MAGISRVVATVLCVWFTAVVGWSFTVEAAPPLPDCRSALVPLQGCVKFVTGISSSPSTDCCTGVLNIHQTDAKCLCVLAMNDSTTQIIPNYNLNLAGQLPTLCKIQGASVANCPALLGETPTSGPAMTAPATGDTSGAYKLRASTNLRAVIFTYLGIILAASAICRGFMC